ncbi:MAG: TetR/AcrR family transcriptional regulator [Solirubrobacteraceae bacterium]
MSTTIEQRQEVRRRELLDAAAALYAERGYRATSMNDLAGRVGLSKPALYHYVRSKQDLLVELYEEVLRASTDSVAAIEAATPRAIDALREVIVQRVAYTCEHQPLLRVFFEEEAGLPRSALEDVLRARRRYEDAVIAIALRAAEDGSLEIAVAPRIYVNALLGAANWVYKWFDPAGRLGPRALGEEIAAALLGSASSHRSPPAA